MSTVTKLQIENAIFANCTALGNSKYGLKEVCSDLLNDFIKGRGQLQVVADGTFLSGNTIDRMMKLTETEMGDPYRPNTDTCERIIRFFGGEMIFSQVKIKAKYANKPKIDH